MASTPHNTCALSLRLNYKCMIFRLFLMSMSQQVNYWYTVKQTLLEHSGAFKKQKFAIELMKYLNSNSRATSVFWTANKCPLCFIVIDFPERNS